MNWNHFDKNKSKLKFKGIVASIYHRKFPKGEYEYVVLPDTVKVLAITKNGKVLLNEEKIFSSDKTFYSLPGGTIDNDEKPAETAKRELLEETGYESSEIIPWFNANYSQTIISNNYFFIAKNCIEKREQNLDSTENIKIKKLSLDEFLNKATSENFKHIDLQGQFMRMKFDAAFRKEFEEKIF